MFTTLEDDCDPKVLEWLTGSVDFAPEEEQEETDPRWAALRGLSSSGPKDEEKGKEE